MSGEGIRRGITASQWVTRVVGDLADHFDVQIAICGEFTDRRGLLGHGKTDTGLRVAFNIAAKLNAMAAALGYKDVSFDFDMVRDLVIRDDYHHFKAALREQRFGKIKMYDEAEWFAFNQYHAFREVRALSPMMDSNRKEGGVGIWILPNVFDTIEKLKTERFQWLLVKKSRTVIEVHVRDGTCDERKRKWGRRIARWSSVPRVPLPVWEFYNELYQDHMDLPCPDPKRCVAALRDRR